MPDRVSDSMPTASVGKVAGSSTQRHGTWILTPGLRLVTTSLLWSPPIRGEPGSAGLPKGPRWAAYAGASRLSAPYRVLQDLAVSRYFTSPSVFADTALLSTPR